MVHWEIEAHDPAHQRAFYAGLFNWNISEGPVMDVPSGIGAPEQISGHIRRGRTSRVVLYIQVRNLAASLDRARELGGTVEREPFDTPGGPTLATIADPEGNRVTLVQQ